MKKPYVLTIAVILICTVIIWDVVANRVANNTHQKTIDVLGPPPTPSKPYNILDYTKPAKP